MGLIMIYKYNVLFCLSFVECGIQLARDTCLLEMLARDIILDQIACKANNNAT